MDCRVLKDRWPYWGRGSQSIWELLKWYMMYLLKEPVAWWHWVALSDDSSAQISCARAWEQSPARRPGENAPRILGHSEGRASFFQQGRLSTHWLHITPSQFSRERGCRGERCCHLHRGRERKQLYSFRISYSPWNLFSIVIFITVVNYFQMV